jgi:hypothetical protein
MMMKHISSGSTPLFAPPQQRLMQKLPKAHNIIDLKKYGGKK